MSTGPYVLDTTILIDVSRRQRAAESWLADALDAKTLMHVSAVTVAEYLSGVHPGQESDAGELLGMFQVESVTMPIGWLAGKLRYDCARKGRKLALGDALIAATALDLGLPLVTSNVRDFRAIDGLDLLGPVIDGTG